MQWHLPQAVTKRKTEEQKERKDRKERKNIIIFNWTFESKAEDVLR
jgi:hypothetical protein